MCSPGFLIKGRASDALYEPGIAWRRGRGGANDGASYEEEVCLVFLAAAPERPLGRGRRTRNIAAR